MRRVVCPAVFTEEGAKCEAWMATFPEDAGRVNPPSGPVVARRSPEPLVICAPAMGFPVASTTTPVIVPGCCCGAVVCATPQGAQRSRPKKRALVAAGRHLQAAVEQAA